MTCKDGTAAAHFPGWVEAQSSARSGLLQQMPPSQDPHHKELVVSQVLLILIGSGMTYCQGEGDCHGPTGMGEGGI